MIEGDSASVMRVATGLTLRDARERANLSQRGAAQAAGIGQAALSNYENGRRDISLTAYVSLMGTYKRDPATLLRQILHAASARS